MILTIAGERMELNRVLFLSGTIRTVFVAATCLFLSGLVIQLFDFGIGVQQVWDVGETVGTETVPDAWRQAVETLGSPLMPICAMKPLMTRKKRQSL